tara:strand:- start:3955 stop:4554 length:600 start_codon:yes stop_codon:yes gene_type:complete
MFNSDARQDQFAANMLEFKRDGHYIDIGACGSVDSNNSKYFESLGWDGICVEIESSYAPQYNNRTAKFINANALDLDYKKLFEENNYPKDIDYASIDIDTLSYDVLVKLPMDEYKFKVITIEHDAYLYGEEYKGKQKEYLLGKGYRLVCENVYVEQRGFNRKECAFEDWYVHPDFFEVDFIDKIQSLNEYPSQIIPKFN